MTQYEGGCICGSVKVILHGEPQRLFVCHCIDCQKSAGGPSQTSAFYDTDNIEVIDPDNKLKKYVFPGETVGSGFDKYKFFCGDCGAPLFNQSMRFEGKKTVIKNAMLSKPTGGDGHSLDTFPVSAECYVKDRLSFVAPAEGVPQFEKGPH